MMKKDIDRNISYINKLLEDTNEMNEYIEFIENEKIDLPSDFNNKILENLEKNSSYKRKGAKILQFSPKDKFFNIVKIVACTVFALILWELVLSKPVSYANTEKIPKKQNTCSKVEHLVNGFSDFLMKPSEIKGGEK